MPSGRKRSCFSMSAEKKPACRSLRVEALELRSMLSAVAGPVAPLVAEASFADLSARVVAASPLRSPGESIRMTVPALMASPEVVAGPTLSVSAEATPAGTTIVAPRTTRITDAIFAQPQDRLDSTDAAARASVARQPAVVPQIGSVATIDGLAGGSMLAGERPVAEGGWVDTRVMPSIEQRAFGDFSLTPVEHWTQPSSLPDGWLQALSPTDESNQGGFIDLTSGTGRRPIAFFHAPFDLSPGGSLGASVDGARLLGVVVPAEHAQPGSSSGVEELKTPEGSTPGLADKSNSMTPIASSGPSALPVSDSSIAMNWTGSWAASEPVSSAAAEGGFAEIDVGPGTSRPFSQTEDAPNVASGTATDPEASNSVVTEPGGDADNTGIRGDSSPQAGRSW